MQRGIEEMRLVCATDAVTGLSPHTSTRKCSLTWTIHNFSLFTGSTIASPFFYSDDQKKTIWRLVFKLNAFVAMDMEYLNGVPKETHRTDYCVSFVSMGDRNDHTVEGHFQFSENNKSHVLLQYFAASALQDNKDLFLPNDILTIKCQLCFKTTREATFDVIRKRRLVKISKQMLDFRSLLLEGAMSDIVLRTEEREIRAHKLILCTRSAVFRRMLSELEVEDRYLDMSFIPYTVLHHLLMFIYCSETGELTSDLALDLLKVADFFQIPDLKVPCSDFLKSNLKVENVGAVLVQAICCGCDDLKQSAVNYITPRFDTVAATRGWTEALNGMPHLASELLSSLFPQKESS